MLQSNHRKLTKSSLLNWLERGSSSTLTTLDESNNSDSGQLKSMSSDSNHHFNGWLWNDQGRRPHNHKTRTNLANPMRHFVQYILLPLIIIISLPILKVDPIERQEHLQQQLLESSDFLIPLLRLPFDRLRLTSGLISLVAAKVDINSKQDLQEEETTHMLQAEHRLANNYAPVRSMVSAMPGSESNYDNNEGPNIMAADDQPVANSMVSSSAASNINGGAPETRNDLPAVRALNVKCEKNHMTVNIVFDRPFYGLVFSKGHYSDQKCVHLPANSGQTSVNFDIHLGKCGMSNSDATGGQLSALQQSGSQQQQPNGQYIENTIIIQYDPQVQEIYDQARKLRCTWYDYYEKSVSFRPYNVDMLDAVTANFLGDNIQCWMQIQVGKGPWSSEVAGIVKIGQTMTMVLAIKDDENRFDMLVRNCVAHDGKHQPIQLVDEYGCVARPKIMAKFNKIRNFGQAATVVSYAHFQAFKFPDSMSVHFQCVIQVCRHECPEPVCNGPNGGASGAGQAGELGGPSGPGDYTASGTEIVASKEPVPTIYNNRSQVNLKLDESQGPVQVKLDTSMMAGLNARMPGGRQAGGGPLPPHLLHTTSEQIYPSRNQAVQPPPSASFYNRAPPPGGAVNGRPSLSHRVAASGQASLAQTTPSISSHSASYGSQPFHQQHRLLSASSSYANRLGELKETTDNNNLLASSDSATSPLTLIATPRALRTTASAYIGMTPRVIPANHRLRRRSVGNGSGESRQDSTNIKTEKTIQVVSPDDVAFSLLSPATILDEFNGNTMKRVSQADFSLSSSSICFSAGRLILAVTMTLATLAVSIVIVAYYILKQRAQFEDSKMTTFLPEQVSSGELMSDLRQQELILSQQMRQEEEIKQRNKYLARLYSQFAPAAYWR